MPEGGHPVDHNLPEKDLLIATARGEHTAFRQLYDLYAARIYRYAALCLGDRHLAEDAVQDTMLAVWRSADSYAGAAPVSTWIFGITHHVVASMVRRAKRTGPGGLMPKTEVQDDAPAPDATRMDVLAALLTLPVRYREAIFLVYYLDLDQEAAARVLGVPTGTLKSRLHNARHRLASVLSPYRKAATAGLRPRGANLPLGRSPKEVG